jgi:hypothetical protein
MKGGSDKNRLMKSYVAVSKRLSEELVVAKEEANKGEHHDQADNVTK